MNIILCENEIIQYVFLIFVFVCGLAAFIAAFKVYLSLLKDRQLSHHSPMKKLKPISSSLLKKD